MVVRKETRKAESSLLVLALLAVGVGAWTGLVVGLFRFMLAEAVQRWSEVITLLHRWPAIGSSLAILGSASAVALAAWLPRRFSPYASGSGIPEVEAALSGQLPMVPLPRLLLVKFFGGILAIGSGMALGPEGPSVQMGAVGARLIGTRFRRSWPDLQVLVAAGTGAGLAVAFNAPIAGAIFVLEEMLHRFDTRTAVAALGASLTAILTAQVLLGHAPLFHVALSTWSEAATPRSSYISAATWLLYLLLGGITGLAGALYNRALVGALALSERFDQWPIKPQAAVVGILIGVAAWFAPELNGSGEELTQKVLEGAAIVSLIPIIFALRFGLGVICYAARTPGGLFAPLLLLGAQLGLVGGTLCQSAFPALNVNPLIFAVVGMASFFAGVVRAPVTGIVLVIEMTSAFTTLLPMLAACFVATVTANLINSPPIYRSLGERLIQNVQKPS